MNYKELLLAVRSLPKGYTFKVIGKTKYKRKIIAVERVLNESFSTAIFIGGIHARENITGDLLFEMIRHDLFSEIKDFNLSFVLLANPDGADLQQFGEMEFPKHCQKKLVKINGNSHDFSMWKANANGVDINNNFNARFGTNVHSTKPASHGFIGKKPNSEKETVALVNYTKSKKVFLTISYHTKGEEIYYNFFQAGRIRERDKLIAARFAHSTGYKIKNVESVSSGGYKDWCVSELKIPSLTIEVGSDELIHPIKKEHLFEIFDKNKFVASDVQFAYNVFNDYKI